MRLPELLALRADSDVIAMSFPEPRSLFAGDTEVGRDELAVLGGESCTLEFGEADEARALD
jgi:hypothetical protein